MKTSFIFLKTMHLYIGILLALLLGLISCSKQLDNFITPDNVQLTENQLENAKTWFKESQPNVIYYDHGSKIQAEYKVQPNWSKASLVNYANSQYVISPVKIMWEKNNLENNRYIVFKQGINNNIESGEIVEINNDGASLSQDELNNILFNYKKLTINFSGEINVFNIGYTPIEFRSYVNGNITKSKILSNGNKNNSGARTDCITWYLETYVNGALVSSEYVGTTCSCEQARVGIPNARPSNILCGGGDMGGGSGLTSYTATPPGSLADYFLCPGSLRVDYVASDRRLISTFGIKVGVNNNTMTYGIDAYLPNQISANNVSWDDNAFGVLATWGKDYDAWAGVNKVGNTYYVSDAALRILVTRASDAAARDTDANRSTLLADKPAYREAIINSMQNYLADYFGTGANIYIELPGSRQTADTPNAVLTDNWFTYWLGNCR